MCPDRIQPNPGILDRTPAKAVEWAQSALHSRPRQMGSTWEAPNRAAMTAATLAMALGLGCGSSSTHSVKRRPWGAGDRRLWSPLGILPGDARRQGAAKLPAWRRHLRRGQHRPPSQEGAVLAAAREEQSFYWSFVLRQAGLGKVGYGGALGKLLVQAPGQEGQGSRAPAVCWLMAASPCPSGNVPRLRLALAPRPPRACCVSVSMAHRGVQFRLWPRCPCFRGRSHGWSRTHW